MDAERIILGVLAEHDDGEHDGDTVLYGREGLFDSLGLVTFLADVEAALADAGHPVILADDRAMSQRRSPFQTVRTLSEYADALMKERGL